MAYPDMYQHTSQIGNTEAEIVFGGRCNDDEIVIDWVMINITEPAIDVDWEVGNYLESCGLEIGDPFFTYAFNGAKEDKPMCSELISDSLDTWSRDARDSIECALGINLNTNFSADESGEHGYGESIVFRGESLAQFEGVLSDYVDSAELGTATAK